MVDICTCDRLNSQPCRERKAPPWARLWQRATDENDALNNTAVRQQILLTMCESYPPLAWCWKHPYNTDQPTYCNASLANNVKSHKHNLRRPLFSQRDIRTSRGSLWQCMFCPRRRLQNHKNTLCMTSAAQSGNSASNGWFLHRTPHSSGIDSLHSCKRIQPPVDGSGILVGQSRVSVEWFPWSAPLYVWYVD